MALKKDHTLDGVEHKDLYISFEHIILEGKVEGTDNRNIRAVLFARKEAGDPAPVCFFDCNFVYDLSSPDNLWKQGYEAAKALPEMAGAVDC
jgi:hypothetical protein